MRGAAYSEELAHFVQNVSEDIHLLVLIEPAIFSDTSHQLREGGGERQRGEREIKERERE